MKRLFLIVFAILAMATIASAQTTLPVTFQWDASTTPGTTDNPIRYRLCTSVTAPATWPTGGLPTDRVCGDAGLLLEMPSISFVDPMQMKSWTDFASTDSILFDEFGIWNQALTADQRTYLWNSGAGRTLYP